jgi:hypothetical protein
MEVYPGEEEKIEYRTNRGTLLVIFFCSRAEAGDPWTLTLGWICHRRRDRDSRDCDIPSGPSGPSAPHAACSLAVDILLLYCYWRRHWQETRARSPYARTGKAALSPGARDPDGRSALPGSSSAQGSKRDCLACRRASSSMRQIIANHCKSPLASRLSLLQNEWMDGTGRVHNTLRIYCIYASA